MRDALFIEIPLASIGYITVVLFQQSLILPLFMLAPVVLIYQSFMLPKLQADTMKHIEYANVELTAANAEIQQLNDELFLTLAKIFDARALYVGSHAAQVAAYAVAIAEEMQLSPERVEIVRQSAYLHDIGKIAIPEAILHKPAKLTNSEYEFIKKHAEIGADFIETSHGLCHLAPFIRHHHERWDGEGYPSRLAGDDPIGGQDSGTCVILWKQWHRIDRIIKLCQQKRSSPRLSTAPGRQFDPAVAKAFIRIAEREGQQLVVNSARTVAKQNIQSILELDGLKLNGLPKSMGWHRRTASGAHATIVNRAGTYV
ncbi:MAG: HD domain-containing protein [Caldilineaceae bacterium]